MAFKVLLHHYGRFTSPPGRKFVDGIVATVDPVELSNFSSNQMKAILTKCLGYDENSATFLYIKKSNRSLDSGLVLLDDAIQDIDSIVSYTQTYQKLLHVYVSRVELSPLVVADQLEDGDDIIFGSTKKKLCIEFEKMTHKKFQMSSMGELTFFLGLQVKQKEYGIFISQDKYVAEILKKFGFSDVKTANTPMETHKPLLKDVDGEDVDEHMYRSVIGSLMYLTSLRPDIMFAVCVCARFQVNPKVSHLHAVKRIFRYLKGQPKLGLWYHKDSPFDLVAYTDSVYARAILDRKSTTGVKNPIFHSKTKHIEIRHHFIRDSNEKKLIQMLKIYIDKNVADLLTKAFDKGIRVNTGDSKLMLLGINLLLLEKVNAARHNLLLLVLQALVDRKKVIITETSVRRDLQLKDVEGIECLPNADIFEQLALMSMVKNVDSSVKFLMYLRFVQIFLDKQVGDMSTHDEIFATPSHPKKVFGNMKRIRKGFCGAVTPLFPTMMVQAQKEIGKGSAMPTDPHYTPIIQPSTSQPQKK
ncbi:uncharacterized mitochondrial protein-like protein [Tanacetum coccineum]